MTAAIEHVLFALPIGSVQFAEQVARRLWPEPAAPDLKALAVIVEGISHLPAGPYRELVIRAVALRQRVERLVVLAASGSGDVAQRAARAAEWSRLARLTREVGVELDVRIAERDDSVLQAAAKLLPEPADVDAEATLAGEAVQLLDPDSKENLETLELPHARDLIDVLRSGRARDNDALFLDMLASWTLGRRAIRTRDVNQLELCRRVVARVSGRTDIVVSRLATQHRRDPEGNARLASWRRFLLDARSRVDEALTAQADPPAPPKASAVEEGAQPVEAFDAIVEHLRAVRRKAERGAQAAGVEPEVEGTAPPESSPRGVLAWLRSRVRR